MNFPTSNGTAQMIVDTLMASSTIQGLVGNRVIGGWSQSSDLQTMLKPAIVVVVDGGTQFASTSVANYHFSLYGVSAVGTDEALAVYDAAMALLHAEPVCGTVSGYRGVVYESQRPVTGWVQDAAVWYAWGRFEITVFG